MNDFLSRPTQPLFESRTFSPAFSVDAFPIAAYTCDAEGLVTSCNEAAATLLGRMPLLNHAADRFLASFSLYSIDGIPLAQTDTWMVRALETRGPVVSAEAVIERPDGSRIAVRADARALADDTGTILCTLVEVARETLAERALREREAQLLAVIENSPGVAVQWYDRDGRVVLWNRASEAMFGYPESEAVGKTLDQLIHTSEQYLEFLAAMAEISSTGNPIGPSEYGFHRRDGEEGYSLSTMFKIPDMHGGDYFVCMDVDITDRRRTEEALKASESHLRAIVESEPECVKLLGPDGTLLDMNPAGLRVIAATSIEQVRGLNTLELIDPRYRKEFVEGIARVFRGESTDHEFEIVSLDGSRHWMEQHSAPIWDSERPGRVKQMLAVSREITDRKRAEAALKESEDRYRELIENTSDGIFLAHASGRYLDANRAGCEMFGYTHDELLQLTIEDILGPEEIARVAGEVEQLTQEHAVASEWRFIRKDGSSFYGEIKARQLDSERYFGAVRDITDRKRAEAERREMETKAQQAQKLESLGVLAGGIAHDFNNLLTAILGYSSLARMETSQENPIYEMLAQIEQAAEQGAGLSQQMLAYSGRGKFVVKSMGLDELAREMTGLLRTVVSKKAEFVLDLAPAPVTADETQIRQIVMNLITNASDALGGAAGEIRIRTGVRWVEGEGLRSRFVQDEPVPGAYAYLEVSDTGCGMENETMARIFDPFYTTKFAGRGLGLAAVIGIVRGHRGTVHVESELDKGTTFEVLLPVTGIASEAAAAAVPTPRAQAVRGTVLVVDDEEHVRAYLTTVLERAGYCVVVARDGMEGLELLEQHGDEILIMLLDLSMPRLDGAEVLQSLHERGATVPVLMMSGYVESDVRIPEGMANPVTFLHKPFRPTELIERLNRMTAPVS